MPREPSWAATRPACRSRSTGRPDPQLGHRADLCRAGLPARGRRGRPGPATASPGVTRSSSAGRRRARRGPAVGAGRERRELDEAGDQGDGQQAERSRGDAGTRERPRGGRGHAAQREGAGRYADDGCVSRRQFVTWRHSSDCGLDRSKNALACAGARYRPIHRPPCPAPGARRRWASSPRTCGGPGTPRPRPSSVRSTPRCGSPPAATRSSCWAPWSRPGSTSWRPTTPSWTGSAPCAPTWRRTSPRTAGTSAGWPTGRRPSRYFSPEFGITAVLPQYSGGLGILAGDHLKAASDLGVPIVGVGLLYKHGYFKQSLSREGWQQETYPVLDPDGLPISALLRGRRLTAPRSRSTCPAARRWSPGSGSPASAGCRC